MKPKFYYEELFQNNIWYMIGWPVSRAIKSLRDNFGDCIDDGLITNAHLGKTVELVKRDGSRAIIIWTKEKMPKGYYSLTHEAVHAANFILKGAGVRPCFDNDETHAYLVGLIVKKALD